MIYNTDKTDPDFCPKKMINGEEYFLYEGGDTSQFGCQSDNVYHQGPSGPIQCLGNHIRPHNSSFQLVDSDGSNKEDCSYDDIAFKWYSCNDRPVKTQYHCPACNHGKICVGNKISFTGFENIKVAQWPVVLHRHNTKLPKENKL